MDKLINDVNGKLENEPESRDILIHSLRQLKSTFLKRSAPHEMKKMGNQVRIRPVIERKEPSFTRERDKFASLFLGHISDVSDDPPSKYIGENLRLLLDINNINTLISVIKGSGGGGAAGGASGGAAGGASESAQMKYTKKRRKTKRSTRRKRRSTRRKRRSTRHKRRSTRRKRRSTRHKRRSGEKKYHNKGRMEPQFDGMDSDDGGGGCTKCKYTLTPEQNKKNPTDSIKKHFASRHCKKVKLNISGELREYPYCGGKSNLRTVLEKEGIEGEEKESILSKYDKQSSDLDTLYHNYFNTTYFPGGNWMNSEGFRCPLCEGEVINIM
mgnify:CR=1 FL=1